MYGHRVLNQFERMSYFITTSWFYKDEADLTEDDINTLSHNDYSNISTPTNRSYSTERMNMLVSNNQEDSGGYFYTLPSSEEEKPWKI